IFHPVAPFRARAQLSVRDHRKLVLVDGEVAFLGGLNLSAQYAPRSWGGEGWHDVHVRVQGPVTHELAWLFAVTWRYAAGERSLVKRHGADSARAGNAAVQVLAIHSRRTQRL